MSKLKRRSDCPISFALDIFGDKWTLLIIRDLMFKGKHSYGEFLQSGEGIATNILADRLALLEKAKIIEKAADPENKAKNIYSLTEKGIQLMPILIEIINWSATYDPYTDAPKDFIKKIKADREELIEKLSLQLKE